MPATATPAPWDTGLDTVRVQYEDYPYPRRDPQDELRRLRGNFSEQLDTVNFYGFEGKQTFRNGFRALVAGGGTGDALVFLAEQLRGYDAELVYVDLSAASMKIAQERIAVRGLTTNIRFYRESLLNLPQMGLGRFDFINCCGVLHHLPEPAAGLEALRRVLRDDGVMSLMVYGRYGRSAVYPLQDLMRRIAPPTLHPEERIALTLRTIEALPAGHEFKRTIEKFRTELDELDGIGVYDLLLHSTDRCYSVPELYEWLDGQGLHLLEFQSAGGIGKSVYDPSHVLADEVVRERLALLSARERHAAAELAMGQFDRHTSFASPALKARPSPRDVNMIPFWLPSFPHMADASFQAPLRRALSSAQIGATLSLSDRVYGNSVPLPIRTHTAALFRHIDGYRTIGDIIDACVAESPELDCATGRAALADDFEALFERLHRHDWMVLRDRTAAGPFPTVNALQARVVGAAPRRLFQSSLL